MSTEWMKVMLGEIARKKTEAELSRIDEQELCNARARFEEQGRVDGSDLPVVLESEATDKEHVSGHAEQPRHSGRGRKRP